MLFHRTFFKFTFGKKCRLLLILESWLSYADYERNFMNQTPQARKMWENIPNDVRMKLLNNVWCVTCSKMTGVGETTMSVERRNLIIRGSCTGCGGEVARLVEGDGFQEERSKKMKIVRESDLTQPDISKLAKFRDRTKAAAQINKIKKLKLRSFDYWNPKDEFSDEEDYALSHPYDKILAAGKRPAWELENILPDDALEEFDCPIGVGIDILESGDWEGAIRHMKGLLKKDERCLDAYAHLGNWFFEYGEPSELNKAKNFYKTGVAIGLKSIGNKIDDVFPWGLINNRPFSRCLHGLGLCYYRQKKPTDALSTFTKMLWLNPSDNQGARFLVNDLVSGLSWEKSQAQDENEMRH